jgi:threonine dehydratase
MAVRIGDVPFAHHQQYLDDVVTVGDAAIRRAMRHLMDRMKLVAEPSGAITVAALMERAVPLDGAAVAILSGGNIEWPGLQSHLSDG